MCYIFNVVNIIVMVKWTQRLVSQQDVELTREMNKCFKRYFDYVNIRRQLNIEFVNFLDEREDFVDTKSLMYRGKMDAKTTWIVHGMQHFRR